jgi:hypothetical protein
MKWFLALVITVVGYFLLKALIDKTILFVKTKFFGYDAEIEE